MPAMRTLSLCLLAAAALLAGCASSHQDKVANAATTPLSDLNVVRADIPEVLKAAAAAPYAVPEDTSCAHLASAIRALDDVLGPDLDVPASAGNPGLLDRGEDAATGALQRTAEGVIPFRGWVRKLSGAERYARHVSAAITAGGVRRGFLRGLAAAKPCAAQRAKAG
jgi:outer membrane murein-binding lipoprotein Lpp